MLPLCIAYLYQVLATSLNLDCDAPCIFYKLTRGNDVFQIDQISGVIQVREDNINYEVTDEYTLVVEAQDRSMEPFR